MRASLYTLNPRTEVRADKALGIMLNGSDNAYPSRMEALILGSGTAKAAAATYASFLTGLGFVNEELNDLFVGMHNYKPIRARRILEHYAQSISYHNGAFVQVGYRWNGDKDVQQVSILPIPFKQARLGIEDSAHYHAKVAVYDNWDRTKKRFNKAEVNAFDVFNPKPAVVEAQMQKAGTPAKYAGQVDWLFLDESYDYPLSPVDVSKEDADAEHQMALFRSNELRSGLFAKYMMYHNYFDKEQDKDAFMAQLAEFQGASNAGSIMLIEDEMESDELGGVSAKGMKLEKIEQNMQPGLFKGWESSAANSIRKAYKAVPTVLIEYVEGKLGGTSGDALTAAADFYNKVTSAERAKISQSLFELMRHMPGAPTDRDAYDIQQLKF